MMKKKPAVKKIFDLKDNIEAYRASALAAGKGKGPARVGHLALASAAAGGAALAIAPAAEAVIVHVSDPPLPFMLTAPASGLTDYNINMDSDGRIDFKIRHQDFGFAKGANILPQEFGTFNSFEAQIITTTAQNFVQALNATPNYNITDSLAGGAWTPLDAALGIFSLGNFPGAGNKYIGVRFTNDTGEHFGWIQVNVPADISKITIVDWAYEDTPDAPILAGATSSAPQAEIPTLNEWGIIVLMTLLAGAAAWKMNKPKLLQA